RPLRLHSLMISVCVEPIVIRSSPHGGRRPTCPVALGQSATQGRPGRTPTASGGFPRGPPFLHAPCGLSHRLQRDDRLLSPSLPNNNGPLEALKFQFPQTQGGTGRSTIGFYQTGIKPFQSPQTRGGHG